MNDSGRWVRGANVEGLDWRVGLLRRIPVAVRGKARFARAILGDLSRVGPCRIRHRDGMWIEVPGFGDSISFFLLVDGVYEPRELQWLDRLAIDGSWVIDVGANVGALAIPLAATRTGLAGVLAIEASPSVARMLERSSRESAAERVVVVPAAAGSQDGEIWFDGESSAAFGQGHVLDEPGPDRVRVPLRTIDSLVVERGIASVSVIKIDVEGHEYAVLAGCDDLLRSANAPAVLFEFYGATSDPSDAAAAQRLLLGYGYRLFDLHARTARETATPVTTGFHTLLALPPGDARAPLR